ncbi:uncharacterized protein C2845_PM18G10560 [Panicum miliaceum]|uniref:Disease resistance N-terminal domain-containing protein n=1 Tax=Panicum miliaceum TaxID=4540 RepID=A0A3L6PKV2_PANMI|nr:uncharacterized protein C2845_PM18G10560 [Panicum miliaceum]
MAELASGAVTSSLGVIRNEWRLLGRVGGDDQFIREEMESMNSFLMHLARTAPPGGEHDEQAQTWMNQVRVLAHDCIDLYLYRGNPDIHPGRDRLRRYLRVLKERARDVGRRRLRYGVEVPKKAAAAPGPVPGAAPADAAHQGMRSREGALVHVDDGGHDQVWTTTATDAASGRIRRALFGLYVREDYFNDQLAEWIEQVRAQAQWRAPDSRGRHDTGCVAFVVPSTESGAIARQASAVAKKHVKNTVLVDIPSLHIWRMLGPKNILYYILREIELKVKQQEADAKSQTQRQQQGQGIDRWRIRAEKRARIREIKTDIKN